jgi:hypothetical protein
VHSILQPCTDTTQRAPAQLKQQRVVRKKLPNKNVVVNETDVAHRYPYNCTYTTSKSFSNKNGTVSIPPTEFDWRDHDGCVRLDYCCLFRFVSCLALCPIFTSTNVYVRLQACSRKNECITRNKPLLHLREEMGGWEIEQPTPDLHYL